MASTLTRAVLTELEQLRGRCGLLEAALRDRVGPLEAALAPVTAVRRTRADPYAPGNWCGLGTCRPASPCPSCREAPPGTRSPRRSGNPWGADAEHTAGFLERASQGVPLGELRRASADNDAMTAAARQREATEPAVLWRSPVFCDAPGCRPAHPCPACAGQLNPVQDKSGEVMGGHAQRTVAVHLDVMPLGSDRPGYVSAGVGAMGTIPMGGQ